MQARAEERAPRVWSHERSAPVPTIPTRVPAPDIIEIHRLSQTRTAPGPSRMHDRVFDLRHDPRLAFGRTTIRSEEGDYWVGGAK